MGNQTLELSKDLLEFLSFLNHRNVRYLVVGGWAVALNGRPRYTKDIDILIEPTEVNAEAMILAINDFGFGGLALTKDDFLTPGQIIQLGHEPNRIDLLTSIPAVEFAKAWLVAPVAEIKKVPVRYLSIDFLIANKTAVGRPQDLADADFLAKIAAKK